MFREENESHGIESAPPGIPQQQQQDKPDPQDYKTIYREEGGGQRGAKYRMFLADGFEPEAAWYFSGPEYREKMKRHDNETRLGIKYCSTCDQALPLAPTGEPEEEIKLEEATEREVQKLMAEFKASEPRHGDFWICNLYLNEGFTIDQAMYLSGPEWAAQVYRQRAEKQLEVKRCPECSRPLPKSKG